MPKRGPNTANGKAAASKNALTHGLSSQSPVIYGESDADWIAFRDGVVSDYEPQGILERAFAARVASLLWRADRVVRYEVGGINDQINDVPGHIAVAEHFANTLSERVPAEFNMAEEDPSAEDEDETHDPEEIARTVELRVIPRGFHLDRILRYETHIHRMLTQTMHELEARQSRRRGEKTHLARLDVSGAP